MSKYEKFKADANKHGQIVIHIHVAQLWAFVHELIKECNFVFNSLKCIIIFNRIKMILNIFYNHIIYNKICYSSVQILYKWYSTSQYGLVEHVLWFLHQFIWYVSVLTVTYMDLNMKVINKPCPHVLDYQISTIKANEC